MADFGDWSTVASDNALTSGVNIGEGCPAANMNNWGREVMAQLRGAVNPVMDDFLASTSLSQARSTLGVASPTSSTSLTNFGNLTNAANKVPYMTGSDNWSTTDFTSFGRSVVATGDAATLAALIGGLSLTSASFGSGTIDVRINLGASGTLVIVGGSGSLAGNTSTTVSFGVTFSSAPVAMVNGGSTNISNEGDVHNAGAATTTGISIANSAPSTDSYTWFAIGKLA